MENRIKILKIALFVLFLGLLFRIGYLQLYQGKKYLRQSEENRLRLEEIDPVRGFIYDRKGRVLVDNSPCYTIVSSPGNILAHPEAVKLLAEIFPGMESGEWMSAARKNLERSPEIKLKRDIEFANLAAVEENRIFLSGIDIKVESKRRYPQKAAAHAFGYLSEISSSELASYKGFLPGDIVGKKGIEKAYNAVLYGKKGYSVYEVDASGNKLAEAADVKGIRSLNGNDVYLTIDLDLQLFAEELLADKQGAVVAIDPRNGEILVLASNPSIDLEDFSGVMDIDKWNELLSDADKPLLDRALQGVYPPGSAIKMAILAAALEEKVVTPGEKVFCPGYMQTGNRQFKCWNEKGHGKISSINALEQSCDVYFYHMGLRLGINRLAKYFRKFGFGSATGIDIEGEASGLVPDSSYMDRRYGKQGWGKGHIMNISIGQGDLLVTPLQLACFCTGLANRGKIPRPHLVKGILYHNPDKWEDMGTTFRDIEGISTQTWDIVLRGMYEVVQGGRGTAHWLMDRNLEMGGKTGTAQNPHGEDHAWFIGFAPFDDPQIAVCALVEHGEHGSSAAAPIVVKIIRRHLQPSRMDEQPLVFKPVG